jgi:hypothetical protein
MISMVIWLVVSGYKRKMTQNFSKLKMISMLTWLVVSSYKRKMTQNFSNLKMISMVTWFIVSDYKRKITENFSNLQMISMLTWLVVSDYKAMASSQKRTVKNIVLGPRSSASIRRPYDNLGANGVLHNRCSYSVTTFWISSTIIFTRNARKAQYVQPKQKKRTTNGG